MLTPRGSKWYAWGVHLIVTGHGTKDGERTVFCKVAKTGKKVVSFPERALLKKGVRTDQG